MAIAAAPAFELVRDAAIPEIGSHARHFRHRRTGAEVLSLTNSDENKAFGVAFKTLPTDHTGVAHILEHSVLSGSARYPVKELFVELLKGSCATFLNAMTFYDKTIYPVASTNLKDLYNLIDVYLDVVLNPLLADHTLDQEGWHLELEHAEAALTYRGVVFNEMKGIYATPDFVVGIAALAALMPDTIYALSAGGDPRHIPELTHAQWRDFHRRYYHPSNARLLFWGDDPEAERLAIVDRALAPFGHAARTADIALQRRFSAPRHSRASIPASGDAAAAGRGICSVAWLVSDGNEAAEERFAFGVLLEVLLGTPASPLKKALLDSGLGEEVLADWGGTQLRQRAFVTGLKGVREDDHGRIEPLILDTLRGLADEGLDREAIEAALDSIEFALRENNSAERGVDALIISLARWLHDGDPIEPLAFEAPLQAVRRRLSAEPRLFERMIRESFLDNPHRSCVWHAPDAGLMQQQEAEEKARLAAIEAALTPIDRARIAASTADLKRRQQTPNTPEQLARLPALRLDDLPRQSTSIPRQVTDLGGRPLLLHDLPTNGIVYLDLGFDLHALDAEELPGVPVLMRALVELGTAKESDIVLARRIARQTGGIQPSLFVSMRVSGRESAAFVFLRGKATVAKAGALAAILTDILLAPNLDRRDAMLRLVREEKARLESELVARGNVYCGLRIKAAAHAAGAAMEVMTGISQLTYLRGLADEIERDWAAVLARFERTRHKLVCRATLTTNLTVDAASAQVIIPRVEALLAALPAGEAPRQRWSRLDLPSLEALVLPSKVNYVAKGLNVGTSGPGGSGSVGAITRWATLGWLIPRIREQGGAYGAGLALDPRSGDLFLYSYRDPNLAETLATFDGVGDYLRTLQLSDAELTRCIVGAVGELDPYQLPGAKGFTSLQRFLIGQTEAERQRRRDQLFATTLADFRAFAALADTVRDQGRTVVMAGEETIVAANRERGGSGLAITKVQ